VIIQKTGQAALRKLATDEIAEDAAKPFQSSLKTAENDLSRMTERVLELEERSDRVARENKQLRLSLEDRFAEIADMSVVLEQACAERDDILQRYRTMDKKYKALKKDLDGQRA